MKAISDIADEHDEQRSGYYNTSFTNIRTSNAQYVATPSFGPGERCIAIKAGMRAGKTTALKEFLRQSVSSKERVLLVTGRIQQALSLVGGLSHLTDEGDRVSDITANDGEPFQIYYYKDRDSGMRLASDRPGLYICQWESLHCLVDMADNRYKSFDYLVCDEVRSILNQACVGVTNRDHLRLNMHLFRDICTKTKCLFLDADLLVDRMVEHFALKAWGGVWGDGEIRVEVYTKQSMRRRLVITDDEGVFLDGLETKFKEAKAERERTGMSHPILIACRSRRGMADILMKLTGTTEPPFLNDGIVYFSSSSTTAEMAVWEDIDKFLSENAVDVILTTSKVTVCADMNTPVTACFVLANSRGGCHVRDLFQTIGRARQPMTEDVSTLITTPIGDKTAHSGEPDFEDIKKSMLTDALMRQRYIRVVQKEVGFDPEDANQFNRLVVHPSPMWMIHLACDNELEMQINRNSFFHSTLIRVANYKGWAVAFKRGDVVPGAKRQRPLTDIHKASGDEIKARDETFLALMQTHSLEDLQSFAAEKGRCSDNKERGVTAAFLVRFPTLIPNITLEMRTYFIRNQHVFDRVKTALESTGDELQSTDVRRLVFAMNKGLMERTPITFEATEKLTTLVMGVLDLDFDRYFVNAPVEESNPKNRHIEDYYIHKDKLESDYDDIAEVCTQIHGDLGLSRTMKLPVYKDKSIGAVRLIENVLKLYGRNLESCKDRSVGANKDRRVYRVVQNASFHVLFHHYVQKEYSGSHMNRGGLKSVLRRAKAENPSLLRVKPRETMVRAVSSLADAAKKDKKSKPKKRNSSAAVPAADDRRRFVRRCSQRISADEPTPASPTSIPPRIREDDASQVDAELLAMLCSDDEDVFE